jgi:acyl-CoA synthetase (NDP forming)
MDNAHDVARLFNPVGVVVWGPVPDESRAADFLKSQHRRWGPHFHLVSAFGGTLGGHAVHTSADSVPDPVDVAALSLPLDQLVDAADSCGRRGLRVLIVVGPGFNELGQEGLAVERRFLEVVRAHGMRVLGPIVSLNSFDPLPTPTTHGGGIGLITHSSNIGRIITESSSHGVGFSRRIPTGEELDLDVADVIEYLAEDDDTAVIACYVEGFRDGVKLRRALGAAAQHEKPVVMIKVGRSEAGARVASSHTAHLTGRDEIIDGLFRQYGVIRVNDVDELVDTANLFVKLRPHPKGGRVALYGISGGAAALMAEQADSHGLEIPEFAPATQAALHEILPPGLAVGNPVDNGNLYRTGGEEQRRRLFDIVSADPAVDVLVCAVTGVIAGVTDAFVSDVLDHLEHAPKPVVVTWNSLLTDSPAYASLIASRVPLFRSFHACFSALAAMCERDRRQKVIRSRDAVDLDFLPQPTQPLGKGRLLNSAESDDLLRRHGVEVAAGRMVSTAEEAVTAGSDLGYPLVAKVVLESVPHKSDGGLVRLGITTADELRTALVELQARASKLVSGGEPAPVLVQRQIPAGVEMLIGSTLDPTLGPAVVVGMGGILAEVRPDISVRPLPLTEDDAREMLADLEGAAVLEGVRGAPAVDRDALVRTILAVADLAGSTEERVLELDLNPVIAGPDGAIAVDSLIRVDR